MLTSEYGRVPDETSGSHLFKEKALSVMVLNNIKRTIPTILSYDFSMSVPIIGFFMTRLGFGYAGPATITLLNTVCGYLLASVLPASFTLADLFGQLAVKEDQQSQLSDHESDEYKRLDNEIVNLKSQIAGVPKNAIVAGLVSIPGYIVLGFSRSVLSLLGQSKAIANASQEFLIPYVCFFITYMPRLVMEFVLLSSKKQVASMLIACSALLITAGIEYALVSHAKLGLTGLGLGAGAGLMLTFWGFSAYVAYHFNGFGFFKSFLRWSHKDLQSIWNHLKAAAPIIATILSDVSTAFVISILAGLLPDNAVEIQNVGTQYLNWNLLITYAVSQTTALIVAEQKGKAKAGGVNYNTVQRSALAGLIANIILQLPFALFVTGGTKIFVELLGANVDQTQARNLLLATVSYAFTDSIRYNLLQSLRAVEDNTMPSIISSSLLWLGVVFSYLLSNHTSLGVIGLPLGLTIGGLAGIAFLLQRMGNKLNPTALQANQRNNAHSTRPFNRLSL